MEVMNIEDWRKYGEIQYMRGRLDEIYKLVDLIETDTSGNRLLDARISKYMDKLSAIDPIAFELYRVERENLYQKTIKINKKKV
jgi:hypothetical protein